MNQRDARTAHPTAEETEDDQHLSDVPVGAGCTEIWEHLSEQRTAND
jgi:hypothetical protein